MRYTRGYYSKWSGKTWSCLGDSITNHVDARSTKNYWEYIADLIGCDSLNYGVDGTGWRTPMQWGNSDAIYQRLGNIDTGSDLITVFAGTNDWHENGIAMTLGVLGDASASGSFYGAVDNVLSTLIAKFPTKTIAVFTPLQRSDAWYNLTHTDSSPVWSASAVHVVGDKVHPTVANAHVYVCTAAGTSAAAEPTWPTSAGGTVVDGGVTWKEFGPTDSAVTLQDIANAITAVANKYNVPVLDLYRNGNFYSQDAAFRSTFQPDGLHPNAAGHGFLADRILAFLDSISTPTE